ncbi:hypothetical protein PUN28_004522 [Cardiocondyla obscurior]|uniref:Chitin-binding type-2 domain-containing protein n=1 Tax=Cardiocondyla obscurior TaxID=286306 RepID=A0AAW2GCZ1_9HYME
MRKYLIAIAFLASWTVIRADEAEKTFEAEDECPSPPDPCPPKLIKHKDCAKYYECRNGQKLVRECASNLFFSKRWNGCVNKLISDCAPPTPPPTSPPTTPIPTSEPNVCPAPPDPSPPVLLNHETDCDKYYECKNGGKALRLCAEGLFFSKKWRGCVKYEYSDCAPPTPSPTPGPGECLDGDFLAHECECNQFYQCINGRKALRYCPVNYHFNPYDKNCQEGTDCDFCKEGEFTYHECDCNMYYECKFGKRALRQCYLGTIFNGKTCVPGTCN